MDEVVLGPLHRYERRSPMHDLRHGEKHLHFAGRHVHAIDAGVFRRQLIEIWIRCSRITVAGSHIIESAEVERKRSLAVWCESINSRRYQSLLLRRYVEDTADESTVFAVVPDYLRLRARNPLQHASL